MFGSLSYVLVGRWIEEREGGSAVKVASIARAVFVLLLPSIAFLPSRPIGAVLLLSAITVSWSLYYVGSSTVIINYASEGSTGVYDALGGLGNVVGGLLRGLIPAMFSFNLLFIMASALFSIGFLIFWKSIS